MKRDVSLNGNFLHEPVMPLPRAAGASQNSALARMARGRDSDGLRPPRSARPTIYYNLAVLPGQCARPTVMGPPAGWQPTDGAG
jgi:hypothetical protein